ncbi:MAG: hypothetical protein PHX61_02375 [Alphaproteobacteria bacterium]|nr:hypothetical protein [Alphaproteobacteria bacterium]
MTEEETRGQAPTPPEVDQETIDLVFIRVNFEGPRNVYRRQGFCMLGQLEGDYGLYYSCSSAECMGYIVSAEHSKIALAEETLNEMEKKFVESTTDKRSKNYKLIEPLMQKTEEFIQKTQEKSPGLAAMMAMRKTETTAHEWFRENNQQGFIDAYNMVSLRKSDYSKFLAKIAVAIHDEFCKCDKIEFNADGSGGE